MKQARALAAILLLVSIGGAHAQKELSDEAEGPPPPPDVALPALTVDHAIEARLLDLEVAGRNLLAVGEEGVIVASPDGRRWQQRPSPTSAMLTRLRFLDEKNGWAVGYDATILHTADGGNTWTSQHRDPAARMLYDVLFFDPQNGIAVGGYGSMLTTHDGGANWEAQHSPLTDLGQHFNRLLRLDDGTLFIAGERGLLARSTDRGASWQQLRTPYAGSYFGAIALGGKKVMVFGMRGHVFVADDITACPEQDSKTYDAYTTKNLEDPVQIAALGWRRVPGPVRESFFGGSRLKDGSFLLVGTNAVAVKIDPELQNMQLVHLPAAETLVDVQPFASLLIAVGKRGIQDLGMPQ